MRSIKSRVRSAAVQHERSVILSRRTRGIIRSSAIENSFIAWSSVALAAAAEANGRLQCALPSDKPQFIAYSCGYCCRCWCSIAPLPGRHASARKWPVHIESWSWLTSSVAAARSLLPIRVGHPDPRVGTRALRITVSERAPVDLPRGRRQHHDNR